MSDAPIDRYTVSLEHLQRTAQVEPEQQVTEQEESTTRGTGDAWEIEQRRALLEAGG